MRNDRNRDRDTRPSRSHSRVRSTIPQSDSESDVGASTGRGWNNQTANSRISGLMRPTISSQNKINHQIKTSSSSSSNLPSVLRRRGMQGAYSSGTSFVSSSTNRLRPFRSSFANRFTFLSVTVSIVLRVSLEMHLDGQLVDGKRCKQFFSPILLKIV